MTNQRNDSPHHRLTALVPKADEGFQQALERQVMSQLYAAQHEEKKPMQPVSMTRRPRPMSIAQTTWGAMIAMLMIAVISVTLIYLNQNRPAILQQTPAAALTETPARLSLIGLPLQPDTLQGLAVGDRVDVLAYLDGRIRMLVADVLIHEIQPEVVMFDAPLWQQGVLIWLSQTGDSYALRVHTGTSPAAPDHTLVDYLFISPELIPEDFAFDMIIDVPAVQAYRLTDLPASIDAIPFTSNGNTLHFWFKDIALISVVQGTAVTLRLPQSDAANLDYLLKLGMAVTFIPSSD